MNRLHELARPHSPEDTGFVVGPLHEKEGRYLTLLDSIDQGYCVLEAVPDLAGTPADYRFLEVNAAFERFAGRPVTVGARMRPLYPDAADRWFDTFGRVSRTGRPERFDSPVGDRWFDLSAFLVGRLGGGKVGVLFADITERKRAEGDLFRSREALRAVLDSIPQRVFWKDVNLVYLGCNRPFAEDMGCRSPDDVIGKTDFECPWVSAAEAYRADDRRVIDTATPKLDFEEVHPAADGTSSWVRTSKVPLYDPTGRVAGVLGIFEDVTERKRVEEQLRNQELMLREAAELAHVGGWSFDPHTRQGDWTPEAARIHGVDPTAEMSVVDGLARFPPADRHRVEAAFMAAAEHGTPCDLEADFTAATGERKRVRAICRPVVEGGRVVRVRGSFQDVTARHALEDKLRQSQKMEAFGQIASGVAHDFNNMLQVINGYADLLLEDLPANDPTAALVREIRRAGERSATLTRQLLAFARQQVVAPRVLDVSGVASGTVAMLRRVLGEGVRLTADLPAGLWPVRIDPGQLEQVLMNLAINARDAMPRGGSLVVATRNEVVSPEDASRHPDVPAGRYVVLAVTDTGVGMTAEVMARVFEPFFTTKEVGQGTGLGLSTVFGIVQQAGGHLRVRSQVGAGSTFEAFLPQAEPEEPLDPRTPRPVTETVLLVEDEEAVRLLIRTVLTGRGYTVLEAIDGEEAERVAAAHAGPIHLVLCDVIMPGADGRAVAAQILARHRHAKTLLMSGHADDVIVRHGVQAAAVPFLKKPFTPSQLAALVRQVIDARE